MCFQSVPFVQRSSLISLSCCGHRNNAWWRRQITKLVVMQFDPFFSSLLLGPAVVCSALFSNRLSESRIQTSDCEAVQFIRWVRTFRSNLLPLSLGSTVTLVPITIHCVRFLKTVVVILPWEYHISLCVLLVRSVVLPMLICKLINHIFYHCMGACCWTVSKHSCEFSQVC